MEKQRVVFIDWLRVIACLMVMFVHSIEPFYLGGEGTEILNQTNALWSTLFDSALRASVPLFVMASSYLLFPVKQPTGRFLCRRFERVFIPFAVWTLVYVVITRIWYPESDEGLVKLAFNFYGMWGHLWFVYMLLGVYLIMPIVSPWIERVGKREEQAFLGLWLFTTLIPFIREASITLTGSNEFWGEANWNPFGLFYYVSGFTGYLLLGHYVKRWLTDWSWLRTLCTALPLWGIGYAITAGWFWQAMPHDYPVEAPIDLAVHMEVGWGFCSFGVALTVMAYFLLIRKITASGIVYRGLILPLSKASYGTYLMHMAFLIPYCGLYRPLMPTGLCILCTALSSFITASLVSMLLSKIPVVGKYVVGYQS